MAHGGLGAAYRLSAPGQSLPQPVQITFSYSDDDLLGTAVEALGIAFQTEEGYWQLDPDSSADAVSGTVNGTTAGFGAPAPSVRALTAKAIAPFPDVSLVRTYRLVPDSTTVSVGHAVPFEVQMAFDILGVRVGRMDRPVLGTTWSTLSPSLAGSKLSDWGVNGIPGGNDTVGTFERFSDGQLGKFGYTAPGDKPNPDVVTASVTVSEQGMSGVLRARITITDIETYVGTMTFSVSRGDLQISNGQASVTWTRYEDSGDVRRYVPTGIISADIVPARAARPCTRPSPSLRRSPEGSAPR